MKRFKSLLPLLASLLLMVAIQGCGPVNNNWYPVDNNDYADPNLTGTWILVQYNSDNIPLNEANWLYFDGRFRGYYYYYQGGRPCTQQIRYWNQYYSGSNRNYISIQYADGGSMEGNYWFTHGGNTLWIQWTDRGGFVQTYVYDRVNNAPW